MAPERLIKYIRKIPRSYYLVMFVAALVNISPFLLQHAGGDIVGYEIWIRCFSEQFLQGDFYPRWCMDVNNGEGTSLFLFYFPLPFYAAAALHFLTRLGFSYYDLFTVLCFFASFMAVFSCFAWLKDVVESRYALSASVLYLFLPYHLEMMFFRGAYSEIWCFALLPLVLKYVRRVVWGQWNSVLPLAIFIGLSLLTHVPLTVEMLLFSGIYVVAMTGRQRLPQKQFALAAVWGFALAVFYIVPAIYYHRFLVDTQLAQGLFGWSNGFLRFDVFRLPGLERPLRAAMLGVLMLVGAAVAVYPKRARIPDGYLRRETMVWLGISVLALFMLFPASAPIYALMGPFSKVFFPWRMQMVMMLGITFMGAVWMQWLAAPENRKKGNLDLAIFCLWVASNCIISTFGPHETASIEQIRASKMTLNPEYRSRWTDEAHWLDSYMFNRIKSPPPKAEIVTGTGTVTVDKWSWRGIRLHVQNAKPVTLRIDESYFPVWKAVIDDTNEVPLRAEDKTGLMLLDVPGVDHHITLTYAIAHGSGYLHISQYLSLLAWAMVAWRLLALKTL